MELGDYLKKGDPIAKVVDLDPIFISINVTEKEIDKIKKEKASVKILDSFIREKLIMSLGRQTNSLETSRYKLNFPIQTIK